MSAAARDPTIRWELLDVEEEFGMVSYVRQITIIRCLRRLAVMPWKRKTAPYDQALIFHQTILRAKASLVIGCWPEASQISILLRNNCIDHHPDPLAVNFILQSMDTLRQKDNSNYK